MPRLRNENNSSVPKRHHTVRHSLSRDDRGTGDTEHEVRWNVMNSDWYKGTEDGAGRGSLIRKNARLAFGKKPEVRRLM